MQVFITTMLIFESFAIQSSAGIDHVPIRINCGGESLNIGDIQWEADRNWEAGKNQNSQTYSTDESFNSDYDKILQTARNYWWPGLYYKFNLESTGTYLINLYFGEIMDDAVGERIFNIEINGITVYEHLDSFAEAGKFGEIIKTFTITITTPQLTIGFLRQCEGCNSRAMVNAIEILSAGPTAPYTPQPVPPPVESPPQESSSSSSSDSTDSSDNTNNDNDDDYIIEFPLKINCGSLTAKTDSDGYTWISDMGFYEDGGSSSIWAGTPIYNTGNIADAFIFRTERFIRSNELKYTISPLDMTSLYTVTLYFAEIYYDEEDQRVFDVIIEGILIDNELDPFERSGGKNTAYFKEYGPFQMHYDEDIVIRLLKIKGDPKISGIEINQVDDVLYNPINSDPPLEVDWGFKKAIPTPLGEISAAAVDDNGYYVWGGFIEDGSSDKSVYYYDIDDNEWTTYTTDSNVFEKWWGDHQTQEVYNGKIYAFGGSGPGSSFMRVFDPDDIPESSDDNDDITDAWSTLKQLFDPNDSDKKWNPVAPASGIIGNKIYVAGGIIDGQTVAESFVYDINNDQWDEIAPMLDGGRNHAAGIGYNGKFYVFAGRQGGNYPSDGFREAFVYNPNNNKWTELASMPGGTGGSGQAVEIGGRLIVVGGESCCEALGLVYSYDIDNDRWEIINDMIYGRHGIAPVVIGNKIYVVGGGQVAGFSTSDTHQVMELV